MNRYLLIMLVLFVNTAKANEFTAIDKEINTVVSSWLKIKDKQYVANKLYCYPEKISLTSLKSCHGYIDDIYITDDIDAYMAYVKQLLHFGMKVQDKPIYQLIINAQYEETTSELYFNTAYSAYRYQRYEEALTYLKKIDDSLDEDLVYHALLVYGLIYFEQGDYEKSKLYLKRVDKSSKHYLSAQYNLGLISMRSTWWSEAEEYFNNAIGQINIKYLDKEQSFILDRLYLTIAYSQVSRKSFRSAKESFSNVSLNSPIKMRALMGIAISEIGLGNLGKAASILKIISAKDKSTVKYDALVSLPQVYQNSGNIKETVSYYNKAIDEMASVKKKIVAKSVPLSSFDIGGDWEMSEINKRVITIKQLLDDKEISNKNIKSLKNSHDRLVLLKSIYMDSKVKVLNDLLTNYITQSKYALAVVYDQSVVLK